ncbi:MAG TPA: nucleotidyltransferase family protein [Gaiellaceae bacterium]
MKALLLAGGYATRLRPLTDSTAKPLLPVGGRPMVDWILDRIGVVGEIDAVHLVTNAVYARAFEGWAEGKGVTVWNDGTHSNEDRLGALGDIQFAIEQGGLAGDDLLVIAADNLFDFSLRDYVDFWRAKGSRSALAVHKLSDPSLAQLYGVVELGSDDRVVGLEEKPEHPRSDLVSTATYVFGAAELEVLRGYLADGNPPDPPGRFLVWLYPREPVYGFRFSESWFDIGNPEQLLEADNRYRERAGLERRSEYTPELLTK